MKVYNSIINLAIDHAMETALDGGTFGITLDDMLVTDLDYAVDICLLKDCLVKAQKTLDLATTKAAEMGLSISVPKTKFCFHDRMIQHQSDGKPLEAVQELNYLGTKIQLDGNITSEVKTRIAKAAGSFNTLSNLWNDRSVPPHLKTIVYSACVRSVLLYGCESWPLKQSDMNMIDSFENRCIRKIIPRGHAISTNQVRAAADLSKRIKSLMQKRRSAWLRHVLRMHPEEIPNAALDFERGELEKASRRLAYLMESDSTI